MTIARTHDMELVRSIMSHPAIWPHIHDDNTQDCEPLDHEGFYWLAVSDGEPAGVFLVHATNSVCFEVHTCLLPRIWGQAATVAASLCKAWVFGNTDCEKIITHVPAYNQTALRFALRCGMKREGTNRASYLKDGKLMDQHLLGITKQEWKCQQPQ